MTPIPRLREHSGPALLSYGFRPFFLFGACYAALAILAWLPLFYGELALATAFTPRDWHVHEMLYGYIPAVVTGFLLTAIPNWTGRLPLQGWPLLVLVIVWAAGRVAVTLSAEIGWLAAALIDSSFLLLVVAAAAREIIAGRNWRNLKVLIPVTILGLGNAAFHIEAHVLGAADYGIRVGIAGILVLIMVIGGRLIPSFTRNWLARENPGPAAGPVRAIRCGRDHAQQRGAGVLDCRAFWQSDGGRTFCGRSVASTATGALGRRQNAARPSRSRVARGLCVCAFGFCADRLERDRCCRAECRPARLDGRRGGHDDVGGDDAGDPGSYRP